MKKSNLGIPCGVLVAVMYLLCLYGGVIPTIMVCAYVLLLEKDDWLHKQSVKVVLTMLLFGALSIIVGLVPDVVSAISSFAGIFGLSFYSIPVISDAASLLLKLIGILKTLVFLLLAYKSLSYSTVKLPFVDNIVNKVASGEATSFAHIQDDMEKDLQTVKTEFNKAKDKVSETVEKSL